MHSSSRTWSSYSPVAFRSSCWRLPWASTPARGVLPAGEKSARCLKVFEGVDACTGSDDACLHHLVPKCSPGRSWLRHPGDCDSVELLLHHCSGLGDFLPVLLLLLGPGLVILQQYVEHRWQHDPKTHHCLWESWLFNPSYSENCVEFLKANTSLNHSTNPNATSPVIEFWEWVPPERTHHLDLCAGVPLTSVCSGVSAGDECSGFPPALTTWVLWTGTWPCVCSSPGSSATSASGREPNPQERWVLEATMRAHHFKGHIDVFSAQKIWECAVKKSLFL